MEIGHLEWDDGELANWLPAQEMPWEMPWEMALGMASEMAQGMIWGIGDRVESSPWHLTKQ